MIAPRPRTRAPRFLSIMLRQPAMVPGIRALCERFPGRYPQNEECVRLFDQMQKETS